MKKITDIDRNMAYREVERDLMWYEPTNKEMFYLCGYQTNNMEDFCRFDFKEREFIKPINEAVSWLATNCAGIQLKFQTTSKRICISVELNDYHNMSHMPATGQCGFDLYVLDETLNEYVLHCTSTYDITKKVYEVPLSNFTISQNRKYILNFPLYMGIKSLKIGLEKDNKTSPVCFTNKGKILLYGTSIAQGGCVSRPGMLYSNMLSRWLDMEVLNYGFSGSAFAEKEIAQIINQRTDQKLLIIDVEANAGFDDTMEKNLKPFILEYKQMQKKVPIIIVSRCLFAMDLYDQFRIDIRKYYKKFMLKLVKEFQLENEPVYFLDGTKFFKGFHNNFTEFTVDGIHPTDLGNYFMALAHYKIIKKILK